MHHCDVKGALNGQVAVTKAVGKNGRGQPRVEEATPRGGEAWWLVARAGKVDKR